MTKFLKLKNMRSLVVYSLIGVLAVSFVLPQGLVKAQEVSKDSGEVSSSVDSKSEPEAQTLSSPSDQSVQAPETKLDDSSQIQEGSELPLDQIDEHNFEVAEPQNAIPEPPPSGDAITLPPSSIKQPIPEADVASGALTYSLAVPAPKGRADIAPNLSLQYNSLNNSFANIAGYGWELSLPSISRKNINGVNQLYSREDFSSSLDGELVGQNGEFYARIDNGQANRYQLVESGDGLVWEVSTKSGVKYYFGQTNESRLSDPADGSKVFSWYLTKVEDLNHNFYTVSYIKDQNQVYPSFIEYTGHPQTPAVFRLDFEYEARPDVFQSAASGFMVTTAQRLKSIESFYHETLLTRAELVYSQANANQRSLLKQYLIHGWDQFGNQTTDGPWEFAYESVAATNLLTQLTLPSGGKTLASYIPSAQVVSTQTGLLANGKLPFQFNVLQSLTYQDTTGLEWSNNYEYQGGSYYYDNPFDKRLAGFETVIQTDGNGHKTYTYYHQGNGDNVESNESGDEFFKLGKPYKTEIYSNLGQLYVRKYNQWSVTGQQTGAGQVVLAQTWQSDFDGNSSAKSSAMSYQYDNLGNLVRLTNYGEVDATDTGFSDTGEDAFAEIYLYAHDDQGLLSLPSEYKLEDLSGNVKAKSFAYYDNLPLGQVALGHVTKEADWWLSNIYAETTYAYDQFGGVTLKTSPYGDNTTYIYDDEHLYVERELNHLSHHTIYQNDILTGQVTKVTDSNNFSKESILDGLGRVIEQKQSSQTDPNVMIVTSQIEYNFWQNEQNERAGRVITTQLNYGLSNDQVRKEIVYSDGFDREIQKRIMAEPDEQTQTDKFAVSDTVYDQNAQVAKTSLPYFALGESYSSPTSNLALYLEVEYDALGRAVLERNVLGQTLTIYDNWERLVTDPEGNYKEYKNDAFQNLIEVVEHNQGEQYRTKYQYDIQSHLIKITDALGNERGFTYDNLGQRKLVEDLHAPDDSTYFRSSYSYLPSGKLDSYGDNNGVALYYGYDKLGRLYDKFVGKNLTESYRYDNCVNGIGRLCQITFRNGNTENYEYNISGQITTDTKVINGQTFVSHFTYDDAGNLVETTNPDQSKVAYEYNKFGLPEKVHSAEFGQGYAELVSNFEYAPTGAMTAQINSNGTRVVNQFDSNNLYRLSSRTLIRDSAQLGQEILSSQSYSYDSVGDILGLSESGTLGTAKEVSYQYDDLYRLVAAQTSSVASGEAYNIEYQYDALGNIIYNSELGEYLYQGSEEENNYANPHAVTLISGQENNIELTYNKGGQVISYDDNGQLTQYVWDYNSKISGVKFDGEATPSIKYGYGSDGVRNQIDDHGEITYYPTGSFNQNGLRATKHILAGANLIATITVDSQNTFTNYNHTDYLGSIIGVSDNQGQIVEAMDYLPFGEVRYHMENTTQGVDEQRGYTGHEYDVDTGLLYAGARYYNSAIGRFLSLDPMFTELGFDLFDPQSMNSYSYVRNNPIRMVDPDGMWFMDMVKTVGHMAWGGAKEVANQVVSTVSLGVSLITHPVATTKTVVKSVYNTSKQTYNSAKSLVRSPQARQEAVQGVGIATNQFLDQSLVQQADQVGHFMAAGILFFVGPKGAGNSSKYITKVDDIIPPARQIHILHGDRTGGGHLFGANLGKSEFPADWTPQQIFHNGVDIATDPKLKWTWQPRHQSYRVDGVREGVNMTSIVDKTKSFVKNIFPRGGR
ncbi:MAG: RHS repeat-associated core domain-containing protein [Candidatus Doudnabacteria bacterium]